MRAKIEEIQVTPSVLTNDDGEERCCERCHKKISFMGTFFKWRGLIIGPECIEMAQLVSKGVQTRKLRKFLREDFLQRKKEDTIRGMIKCGLLDDGFQGVFLLKGK